MAKWPKPYDEQHEPPARIYLGIDTDTGKLQISWWPWRTMHDDIVYIRKDIADKRVKEVLQKYEGSGWLEKELV